MKLTGEQMDGYPELFRVVTDGNGRLLLVAEEEPGVWEVLSNVELPAGDFLSELEAHHQALRQAVDEAVEQLVDPMG